jgi:MiaB/RimO family radical SAM methylthiotransferase
LSKIYVSCNGCEDGRLSSAYVEKFFTANRCTLTRDAAQADLIVFYACGLTKENEDDSLRVLKRLQSIKRADARLITWGCLTKINPQLLATVYDGPLIGPKNLNYFETVIEKVHVPMKNIRTNTLLPQETTIQSHIAFRLTDFAHRARTRLAENRICWIYTVKGCSHACTYCSDRCAWGEISSRPTDTIVSEFKTGLLKGYDRFCLIGSDLGAYGTDTGDTLINLLTTLVNIDDQKTYKITLPQMNPYYLKHIHQDLDEIFDSGKIGAFGCQVQSGSNRILQLMGRRYTAEEWTQHMQNIRKKHPKIHLETHLLVGFPTETDQDFKATLNLLDKILLDKITVFKYSTRPHVAASHFPGQIPEKTKKARWRKLSIKARLNTTTRKIQRSIT